MTVRLEADAVFTVDAADTVLAPGAVEIDDGLISWVGDPWQVPPAAGTEVHRLGGLLMPGLVNCHGHSPMTLVRSAGDGLPLERWLRESVWPREARLEDEDVYWGMLLGAAELLCNGVTTTCEQYRHPAAVVDAVLEAGHPRRLHAGHLRRARCRPGEAPGRRCWPPPASWPTTSTGKHERLQMGFGPHAAYTVPPEGLRAIAAEARARDALTADPSVRDCGRVPGGAGALRHERTGAAGLRRGSGGPGAGSPRCLARRRRPRIAGRARCGRGALPGLEREAGLGHRAVARAA